jgi:hypothetical protein
MEIENEGLKLKVQILEDEIVKLKIHLKNYTAPARSKTFYENHKEEIIQKVKDYKISTNYQNISTPEQRKQYNKTAYLKRKEKLDLIQDI